MKNFEYLKYTYLHRKALKFIILRTIKDEGTRKLLLERAKYHDLDKALLYTLIEKKEASKYHRATASHHMKNNGPKCYLDYVEAILDYECAALTKPDKPLNAYDTINKYPNNKKKELLEVLHGMNMDSSYSIIPCETWDLYVEPFENVTEEMIMKEIYTYCTERPEEAALVLEYAKSL